MRNPYRFSFDRETGALAIADPGADEIEEINYVERDQGKGLNFGWPRFEGDSPFRTDYDLNKKGGTLDRPDTYLRPRPRLLHHRGLRGPRPAHT